MADIGSILASAVIFLFNGTGQIPLGTAFIVGYPFPKDSTKLIPLVVTARHVIGDESVVIGRFTPASGDTPILIKYDLDDLKKSGDFWEHPDSGVDIVVFRSQHFKATTYQPLPLDLVASTDVFKADGIQTTDRVIFPSLLVNFMGSSRNYPVIRDGTIALIPDEDVPMKYKVGSRDIETKQEVIFLEATSIPGASGSPILLWPGPRLKNGAFAIGGQRPLLLGVMHGFYPSMPRDIIEVIETKTRNVFAENSGIAIVFPSWKILEIINSDAVSKRIEQLISESK